MRGKKLTDACKLFHIIDDITELVVVAGGHSAVAAPHILFCFRDEGMQPLGLGFYHTQFV